MGPPRGGFGDGGFGGGFGGGGGRTPNPYATSGGGGWGGGRTPNPYASGGGGGKTPAWSSSKTPNPEGGRTPFTSISQTPNPYTQDGGRTPGWGPSARTPNPYTAPAASKGSTGSGWGGATPGWGGGTPKPPAPTWNESSPAPQSNPGWASPGPTSSGGGGWGGGESSWVSAVHCVLHSYTHTNRAHRPPLSGPQPLRPLPPPEDRATDRRFTTHKRQPECSLIVLICPPKRQPLTRRTNGQGKQHSVSF
jgi:hypothetical protein